MNNSPSETYLLDQRFSDVEEFIDSVREWDLDFRQLAPGQLNCHVLQAGVDDAHLTYARFSQHIDQQGVSPLAGRTFALLDHPSPLEWCGRQVGPFDIMAFHPSGRFESASSPGFQVFTLTVPEAYLTELATFLQWVPPEVMLADQERVWTCKPALLAELRTAFRMVTKALQAEPGLLDQPSFVGQIKEDLPRMLLATLRPKYASAKKPPLPVRRRALRRARDFIRRTRGEPIRMSELCAVAGASERTLEYAFKESYGVTPKMYIKAHRLISVRRSLAKSDPNHTRIADVASQWGFWHMGQFAADYRRLFGELPKQTLARSAN